MKTLNRILLILSVLVPALHAAAAELPPVIRFGVAQPATGNPPSFSGSSVAIAHAKGWIEDEFKGSPVKIEWLFFKGAGPAVNEALSNRQLDFAFQGDLPAIVAKAAGLKTKLILATGVRANIYLAVPPDSTIRSVEDLRGKRVSIFKGTNSQLPINRVLEAHGLSEKDVRAINLDNATALAALSTRDLDGAFGGIDLLRLREKGAAKIAYTSKGGSPVFTRQSHVLVTEAFAERYPEATQRVVNAIVRTAKWASDEANREEVLRLWARAGTPYEHWVEDYAGEPLKVRINPQFDPFLTARYKDAVEQAYKFKLTRAKFDAEKWIDRRFLDAALKNFKLEGFWPVFDANGKLGRGSDSL
ncbi:MAG: nitrate transporter substrate-binding protein [Betaproteobacteria bacterium]|nr:nitrate transporter substrate-binding protein [Betaproteobacteria bacterium]